MVSKRRSVVFVLSDFLDATAERALRIAARRHDVIAVVLDDPRERELPDVGLVELEEARPASATSSTPATRGFGRLSRTAPRPRGSARDRWLHAASVDAIMIATDRPYTEALLRFFRMRERRQ
jgi:hypothetical protein